MNFKIRGFKGTHKQNIVFPKPVIKNRCAHMVAASARDVRKVFFTFTINDRWGPESDLSVRVFEKARRVCLLSRPKMRDVSRGVSDYYDVLDIPLGMLQDALDVVEQRGEEVACIL